MPSNFAVFKSNTEKYEEYKKFTSEYIMNKYHTDETFKNTVLERKKIRYQNKKEEHYKRLDTDEDYKNECKKKGMRDCRNRIKKSVSSPKN